MDQDQEMFFEQANGTYHKMVLPAGKEPHKDNLVFAGKYRAIDNDEFLKLRRAKDDDKIEIFSLALQPEDFGIPKLVMVVPLLTGDTPNE